MYDKQMMIRSNIKTEAFQYFFVSVSLNEYPISELGRPL